MTRGPAAIVALALLAVVACHRAADEEMETTNPVPVTVVAARVGAIRAVVRAAGVASSAPGAELSVVAPVPSRIAALPHAEGDRVRKGELLVRFEAPDLQADAAARRADLDRGRSHVTAASAELERLQGLYARGVAAQREVEAARRELADAEAEVATARTALQAASTIAGRTRVVAPFDGVVAARLHNPGDMVEAAAADPVLRFVDPTRLQISAAVALGDLAGIAVGQPARVLAAGAAAPIAGTVAARPAAVDPATSSALVRIALSGGVVLPPSSPVVVDIDTVAHPRAIAVPAAAIVQEGPETFVYVVGADHHAHRRAIETGVRAADEVEVVHGVRAGELVVVEGQTGLPDGAEVVPTRASAAAASGAGPEA